jgi:hypothetical protein
VLETPQDVSYKRGQKPQQPAPGMQDADSLLGKAEEEQGGRGRG